MKKKDYITIVVGISFCISLIFISVATPIYISNENYNETKCLVNHSEVTLLTNTCEDKCDENDGERSCTYKDCWTATWYAIINDTDSSENGLGDWIYGGKKYDNKEDAIERTKWRKVGIIYDCWYKLDERYNPEITWFAPHYTATIVLFTLAGVFILPPIIYSCFLCLRYSWVKIRG